jgi:protein-histidine pros-kinase
MDDFLSKPIRAADLAAAIDRVVVRPPENALPGLLDATAVLAACGSDGVLLAKICQSFRERLPAHLAALQDALQAEDSPRLREAAHKLAGMLAVFSSAAATVALDVEHYTARGQLEGVRSW